MTPRAKSAFLSVTAALIWGTAFVGQSTLADVFPPLAINAMRGVIASFTLLLAIYLARRLARRRGLTPPAQDKKHLFGGGIAAGVVLTVAANLQQAGLAYTSAGKASFITALYIVLVPLCGLLTGRRCSRRVLFAVALAGVGLYLISVQGGFAVEKGDFLVFLCALCFTAHILVIDRFSKGTDGLCFSCVQFATSAVLSGLFSLWTERVTLPAVSPAAWLLPLLYIGIFSSGIAYTLQILAQKDGDPTVVSLLLSLESVFGALSGAILLHERMTPREVVGCLLMFLAVLLAQIPEKKKDAPSV